MRLINVNTLQLEEFMVNPPPYATLSHTWVAEEVTFADFGNPGVRESKSGWSKITGVCAQAARDEYQYVWVDTCCIDKSSSAELSEAINSMYAWYAGSGICYVYLADVEYPPIPDTFDPSLARARRFHYDQPFASSRWFRRGWTLQELLAPPSVVFYDNAWRYIGNKANLSQEISRITGIPDTVLDCLQKAQEYPLAYRLSWAAGRETTRPEDTAYCLLGLLDVNMPLLYGEGTRAFLRLQEEILRQLEDDTIFLWCSRPGGEAGIQRLRGIFADSPDDFANFREDSYYKFRGLKRDVWAPSDFRSRGPLDSPGFSVGVDNRGVRFVRPVRLQPSYRSTDAETILLWLNCSRGTDSIGIFLEAVAPHRYARTRPSDYVTWLPDTGREVKGDAVEDGIIILKDDEAIRKHLFDSGLDSIPNALEGEKICAADGFATSGLPAKFQYGFYIKRAEAGAQAASFSLADVHLEYRQALSKLTRVKTLSRPRGTLKWQPLIASGFPAQGSSALNMLQLIFRRRGTQDTVGFSVMFERECSLRDSAKTQQAGVAISPAASSRIGLCVRHALRPRHHRPPYYTDYHSQGHCSRRRGGNGHQEMTLAEARGTGGRPPKKLVATNKASSIPYSLSLKFQETAWGKLLVLDFFEGRPGESEATAESPARRWHEGEFRGI